MPAHQSVLRGHNNTNKAFLGIKLGAREAPQQSVYRKDVSMERQRPKANSESVCHARLSYLGLSEEREFHM